MRYWHVSRMVDAGFMERGCDVTRDENFRRPGQTVLYGAAACPGAGAGRGGEQLSNLDSIQRRQFYSVSLGRDGRPAECDRVRRVLRPGPVPCTGMPSWRGTRHAASLRIQEGQRYSQSPPRERASARAT